jgi:hypothetical protein
MCPTGSSAREIVVKHSAAGNVASTTGFVVFVALAVPVAPSTSTNASGAAPFRRRFGSA